MSIALYPDGTPRVLDYLGTVVRVDDRRGAQGANCGNLPDSPFSSNDIIPIEGDYGNAVTQTRVVEPLITARIRADVIAALAATGVSKSVTDRLAADIDVSVASVESLTSRATGTFRQYQLDPRLLNNMQSTDPSPRLAPCALDVRSGRWRLYQAISGWHVQSVSVDVNSKNKIVAELVAQVRTQDPSADLAAVEAAVGYVFTQAITTQAAPHFVVLGVSFWDPTRI